MKIDNNVESIKCPQCNRVSYHSEDIKYKFCGNCHEWHEFMKIDKWISVKSCLPRKGGMYLVCYYRDKIKGLDAQVLHFDNYRNKFNTEYSDDEPRYWMPLDEFPNEDEK